MTNDSDMLHTELDEPLFFTESEKAEWESLRLSAETAEVLTGKLCLTGAASIKERSTNLLQRFATEAFSNPRETSPELTMWIAMSIAGYLNGKHPSLDAAFGLKRRGRPTKLTPDLEVAMAAVYSQVKRDWAARHGERESLSRAACEAAEGAAYMVLYGVLPAESNDDKGSIEDGLTRVRAALKNRRVYISPN